VCFHKLIKLNSGIVDQKRIAVDLISGHTDGLDLDPLPRRLFDHEGFAGRWVAAPTVMDNGISFVERSSETVQQNAKCIEGTESRQSYRRGASIRASSIGYFN
jgi:hypothetical protein